MSAMSQQPECFCVRRVSDWNQLAAEWKGFLASLPEPTAFQDFPFLRTWWEYFGEDRSLFIVVARRGTEICGIAPLQLTQRRRGGFAFPTLEFLGMPDELDRPQFLVAEGDTETLRALLEHIAARRSEFSMMQLDELPAASWQLAEISQWAANNGLWMRSEPLHPVPYLTKESQDWHGFLEQRSKHFRKRLRASQRKAERRHALRYEIANSGVEAKAMVDAFIEIESRSWKQESGVDVGSQSRYRNFYQDLLGGQHRDIEGHAIVQYVDNLPSAATLGFSTARCYYSLQIAHDLQFSSLSPGTLLEAYELEWFFQQDLDRYEFLGGAGFNKRRWTNRAIDTCSVHIRKPGVVMAAADAFRFYAKPWLRRFRSTDERPQAAKPFDADG